MHKGTILLIEDDHRTEVAIIEALGRDYQLETVKNQTEAAAQLERQKPDLVIIDFDLKEKDGLEVYKNLGLTIKTIMLSASGSIPTAVAAAKLGIEEFLRKPVNAEQLKTAVENNFPKEEIRLAWPAGMEWLQGDSRAIKKTLAEIQAVLRSDKDIVLVGGKGVARVEAAEFIHANSRRKGRRFRMIDAAAFRKEAQESHFWVTVREILSLPTAQAAEERCGTLYIENTDAMDEVFLSSVFKYFKERSDKIDKSIRIIFGTANAEKTHKYAADYFTLRIPSLSERKEDLPFLVTFYLKKYARRFGREINALSTDALDFIFAYNFPGDYLELERLLEDAVLTANGPAITLKNIPVNLVNLTATQKRRSLDRNFTLDAARRAFNQGLFQVLTAKTADNRRIAKFIDLPEDVLAARFEDLAD
ncbi:MAG: response regulator [Candidatus Margulisiibacteriota bacterium]